MALPELVARLDEIAEGMSTVLAGSTKPEPLFLDMMNHTQAEVTFLIRAVVHACERRGAPLSRNRLGIAQRPRAAKTFGPGRLAYEGVAFELASDLDRPIECYRFPKDPSE